MRNTNNKKVSVITVVYNNVEFIQKAITSLISQDYDNIEYILIDGGSTDGTCDIVKENIKFIDYFISETDTGIYDALNKGIMQSTGDVISILHSDDVFYDESVISDIVRHMDRVNAEFCFSNMLIIDRKSEKISRYCISSYFKRWLFRLGWMPPHPTCFINKSLFDEFGLYSDKYKISGDFDLLVRFFYGRNIKWSHLDRISIKMSSGGVSNSGWQSKRLIFNEINLSLKSNGIWSLPIFQLIRYLIRLIEMVTKPKKGRFD